MGTQTVVFPSASICSVAPSLRCGMDFDEFDCIASASSNLVPCTTSFSSADGNTGIRASPRRPLPASAVVDGIRRVRSLDSGQITLIDIRTCDLTLSQVMEAVRLFAFALPGYEIFMDGDVYAVVARARVNATSTRGALS